MVVAAPVTKGLELAVRTDTVLQRMRSDASTSVRGGSFTPTLEVGLRQDGDDAETGTGIEVGGGMSYVDPASGLTAEAKVPGLVAHEDTDYSEWGVLGAVRIAPGAVVRGLPLSLAPAWGADSGGAEQLRSHRDARGERVRRNDA